MNPVYLYVTHGLAIAVAVILLMVICETLPDIKAAKEAKNGRLAAARVRLIREITLLLVLANVVAPWVPMEIRRMGTMSLLLVLALCEVYLRLAIRHGMGVPASVVRLFDIIFGPRE